MSEELKPCPFCGSTKLKIDKKSVLDRHTGLGVRLERHTYSVQIVKGGGVDEVEK